MTDMRATLNEAVRGAGLTQSEFVLVGPYEYERILLQIADRFTTLGHQALDAVWWWEHFAPPVCTAQPPRPIEYIDGLMDPNTRIWFIAEDDGLRPKRHGSFWLYDTTVRHALAVLRTAPNFEYYCVSHDLAWLVCENHHGMVIGSGAKVVQAMQQADPPCT